MLGLIIFTTIILTACSAKLFVPPEGSYFKLQSLTTGKCMHDSDKWGFNTYWCGQTGQYNDQYWTLISFPDAQPGHFQIKNKVSNRCIVGNSDGRFRPEGCLKYSDQLWQFVESVHHPNYFAIVSQQSHSCIENNPALQPSFFNSGCNGHDDQFWRFVMEDSEVKHVAFDIDKKTLTAYTPFVAGEQVCDNTKGSKEPQTLTMHASKTITETSSFSNSVGVGMSASATFSSGVPMIASAELTVEVSANYEHTWGKEESKERTIGTEVSITCGAGEKLEQKCVAHQGALTVPYTMTLITKGTNREYEISGLWTGTPGYGIQCEIIAI